MTDTTSRPQPPPENANESRWFALCRGGRAWARRTTRALIDLLVVVTAGVVVLSLNHGVRPHQDLHGPSVAIEPGSVKPLFIPEGTAAQRCVTVRAVQAVSNVEMKVTISSPSQPYTKTLQVRVDLGQAKTQGSCENFLPLAANSEIFSGTVADLAAGGGIGQWAAAKGLEMTYRLTFEAPDSTPSGSLELSYSWSGSTPQ